MSQEIPFTHLHTHSHYSLLQALPQIKALVARAEADGQKALALTDSGALYGAIEFYKECKKKEIKPIIGMDAYVAPRSRHEKEHRIDNLTSRLVLLAKNETGYKNLIKLASRAAMEGFYYHARVDRELLEEYREGLIAILPSFSSELSWAIKNQDIVRAKHSLAWHKETFGDDLYIEITMHDEIEGHKELMQKLISHAREASVPILAAHDTYYLDPEDALARELVNKIRTGGRLERDLGVAPGDFSFITQDRARTLFKDLPEALENTARVADMCSLELNLGSWVFPEVSIPKDTTHDEELRKAALEGLKVRGLEETEEVITRIDHELGIISKKGYSPYFLAVSDLLSHAREAHILTNTRGSAAGSLVSYLTGITTVNPLEYRLPFERFLNPERPSPPDIDMDLADNRRDDLINYAREKYGADHVAQIGTFGTMAARAAVRDVSRALGHSYNTGDQIAKLIPFGAQGFPMTIERALNETPELKEAYDRDPDTREILDLAQKIEGNARHVGVHAAGVVISPTPVTDFVPVQPDPKGGKVITQFDMHATEDAGLLKFDFLGLKNLSVLADSVSRVKARLDISLDMDTIPLDDAKTFEMLSQGKTLGVFQMAGSGMTSYLVGLKPSTIHDINAMVALYRPGPMEFIPEYTKRKHHPQLIKYLHPDLEPILSRSYGVIAYQDDVMQIAIDMAGYSWLEADMFRKAMGKKIPELMAEQKDKFFDGCKAHGIEHRIIESLWAQIETFAAYGFNKAHAASYGNLAYKTAFMKANYPVDYMAALLTADSGDVEKIGSIVGECVHMGITVLPPDVNESFADFTVTDEHTIRFGLTSIKNFGEGIASSIVTERKASSLFTDLGDFLARIADRNLNKKSLESLIQAGALDSLGERGQMLTHIDLLLQYHREHLSAPEDQGNLFGDSARTGIELPPTEPADVGTRLLWEKELLGLYISGHPLDAHQSKLTNQRFDIKATKEKLPKGLTTVIAGLIETRQDILTKKGEKMCFLSLSDYSDQVEVVCFPKALKEYVEILTPGTCVLIKGKMSERNGELSFMTDAVKKL